MKHNTVCTGFVDLPMHAHWPGEYCECTYWHAGRYKWEWSWLQRVGWGCVDPATIMPDLQDMQQSSIPTTPVAPIKNLRRKIRECGGCWFNWTEMLWCLPFGNMTVALEHNCFSELFFEQLTHEEVFGACGFHLGLSIVSSFHWLHRIHMYPFKREDLTARQQRKKLVSQASNCTNCSEPAVVKTDVEKITLRLDPCESLPLWRSDGPVQGAANHWSRAQSRRLCISPRKWAKVKIWTETCYRRNSITATTRTMMCNESPWIILVPESK